MPKDIFSNITQNLVGYVLTAVVTGLLALLLSNSGKEARLESVEKRVDEQAQVLKEIQKTLAEGGPAALAQRVDGLSKALETQNAKLDRLLELAASRRP